MPLTAFDPDAILAALQKEGVRCIVIGGLAAVLHGSPLLTQDIDICPARDPENLKRLAIALRNIGAKIRTEDVPEGLPFACDELFFRNVDLVNLTTPYGDLDVTFVPSGTGGYADLSVRARPLDIGNELVPPIADLEDVIRSKQAANRPKDVAALPTLLTSRNPANESQHGPHRPKGERLGQRQRPEQPSFITTGHGNLYFPGLA